MHYMDFRWRISNNFRRVTEMSGLIGAAGIWVVVLVTFVDVILRYLFNAPLPASFELIELSLIILGSFGITYAAAKRGHIAIDLVVKRFPRRVQRIGKRAVSLLCFAAWALLAYEAFLYGLGLLEISDKSTELLIPLGPFYLTGAIALFICCLAFLTQAFRAEMPGEKKEETIINEP